MATLGVGAAPGPGPKVTASSTSMKRKREEQDNADELIGELFDTISDGNHRLASQVLKEAKKPERLLQKKDLQGLTPLKKAITLNKAEIARILVSHGASPSVRDPLGKTPLHIAVMQGRRELVAPLLVSVDSSVNVQDKAGWTPLHYAIRGKHLKVIEWLLYAGADVNIKNKDDVSPLDVTEEDSLMWKMLKAHNVDRDLYPVTLSCAFISRKELNYIGTDGQLMFLTSQNWSPSEQFFFCKRIRPSEARPLIPLRWNEYFYSDVYHYRTMRRLNPGESRVKLFILFSEELKVSEIVLKVTSKDNFLGEVPLLRSTYIQDKYMNFMGSCELDIKSEGQFVVVKRYVALQLRKNEEGVLSCEKYPNFLFDLPSGATPSAPRDWNTNRLDRATKEKDQMVKATKIILEAQSKIDFFQEFYDQTAAQEPEEEKMFTAQTPPKTPPVLKLDKSQASRTSFDAQEEETSELGTEDQQPPTSKKVSAVPLSDDASEVVLEPMLEAYEPDNCDDFYYISRGWGLYVTVMRAFALSTLMDPAAKEKSQIHCVTDFYHLSHTSEQNPTKDCLVQIPKSEDFVKVGTVLVFARKNVTPEDESPDPDDSAQEYLLSDDMKTSWGVYWQNQERDRWALIGTGISNKQTRVIFKTRLFATFVVVQLTTGEERAERENDDESSSEEEVEEDDAGEGDEDGGDRDDAPGGPAAEGGEEGDPAAAQDTAGGEGGKKKVKSVKKKSKSAASSVVTVDDLLCLQDEPEPEEDWKIGAEQAEGEAEGEGEDGAGPEGGEGQDAAGEGAAAEDTGEPGAPAPSPMVNKEENKDDNTSNVGRPWSPATDPSSSNNNNNININTDSAARNKNNNEIRDNDEDFDQSTLAPEERTIIVGPPPVPSSFAKLSISPSVFRSKPPIIPETEESAEHTDNPEDSSSEVKSSAYTERDVFNYSSVTEDTPQGNEAGLLGSKSMIQQAEEVESDEDLPDIAERKLSIAVIKNGVKKLQEFKFGPKLTSLPLAGVDLDQVKTEIAQMWRYRNHRETCILVFSRPRGEGEFDMVVDVVQRTDTYVRAESQYSMGFRMVGESAPLAIKTGRFLSFTIEGPLIVERCEGGVSSVHGNLKTRTMYFSHSQISSIEYVVKRPQVEEVKGPTSKKGKKKEETKVDTEPDARLEVMAFNAGSGTNGVDLAVLPVGLTGPDLWHERHVHLRASDNKLLTPLIECLSKSRALARNWWRLLILLGFTEKEVEGEKGRTQPNTVIAMYVRKWFEDSLNLHDRGILRLIQTLDTLKLDVAIDNVVRIIKIYKAHLLREPVRPRYLKLLFHWVLQTKITRNNLLRVPDPQILRPVSDAYLLHLSEFLPKQHLFKIGAAMDVEENVLHAISGEEIIHDDAYLGFRVLIKSRQKKDEIIHYTLLLMEMFKQVELPDANAFMVRETKKWMETVADTDPEICNKLESVFS